MENLTESLGHSTGEAKQLIGDAKNIYLIPSQEPEALALTVALFYTLKELGKNVNLIIESLPENLKFLSPSLDYISYPKNFVISIPNKVALVSQIFYEKNDEALKIHLTLENGNIKKENIAFYYSETKPDLVITIGVADYQTQLKNMDSFGFLLDSPILNIDTLTRLSAGTTENKKFGKINLIETSSLTEIVYNLIKTEGAVKKELAVCLLSGVVIYTENFKKNLTANIFEMAGILMKSGASLEEIVKNIYSKP